MRLRFDEGPLLDEGAFKLEVVPGFEGGADTEVSPVENETDVEREWDPEREKDTEREWE